MIIRVGHGSHLLHFTFLQKDNVMVMFLSLVIHVLLCILIPPVKLSVCHLQTCWKHSIISVQFAITHIIVVGLYSILFFPNHPYSQIKNVFSVVFTAILWLVKSHLDSRCILVARREREGSRERERGRSWPFCPGMEEGGSGVHHKPSRSGDWARSAELLGELITSTPPPAAI